MFESLAETDRRDFGKRFVTMLLSIVLHVVVIIVIVILPLVYFNVLPEGELLTFLIAPPEPPAPPPPPAPPQPVVRTVTKVTVDPNRFVAPTEIPKEIPPPVDEPVIATSSIAGGIAGGVTGGVVGGVPGGVLGGVLSGSTPTAPPPPPPKPVKRAPTRIGGDVIQSKLIKKIDPVFPELAKRARISGSVVLLVTVDEEGNVSEINVEQGHPLLRDAAVQAVKQWKYSPTILNGEPVPVIATVTVIFNLR